MRYDSNNLKDMSDSVRALALHSVLQAHSGHIGIILGTADIMTCVFANFLRRGVDRFVLSAGHGSALLYSVLKLAGYNIGNLNDFRKVGGLPGHPEYGIDGVDATTGPLGQGIANAVGLALAEKIKKTDAFIYCLCSDGDLSEGVAQEAIAFAGRYQLNNLILLWDDNGITIDGVAQVDLNVVDRMKSAGWNAVADVDGADFDKINTELKNAKKSKQPVFIQCKDVIGRGSKLSGTAAAHGLALNDKEMLDLIQKFISVRGDALWNMFARTNIKCFCEKQNTLVPKINTAKLFNGKNASTRELSEIYLNALIKNGANLIGGSADLGKNTGARVECSVDILPNKFKGNYVNYGIREHAMAGIMNGMAIAGLRPYGSTFLVFSDYMRPAIRLSAMSKLPVIYVFSHDSIAVGEDGPTHQPIEQLASLRLIPELNVFRPCNMAEIAWAWNRALCSISKPSCIILSRQKFNQIDTPKDSNIDFGAYVIYSNQKRKISLTIIATGSEVSLAVEVAKKISIGVQVVSVPSVSDFKKQKASYKNAILRGFVVVIEASVSAPWFEFADAVIGIDSFGISGDGNSVYKHFGFDIDAIVNDIIGKIK
ncbi:MAG: transketolase-like TK C-terminal-containing protein [Alphaproteobacteria bacterium]